MPVKLEDFIDNIDHVVQFVGIDHVACGSDGALGRWPTNPAYVKAFMAIYSPERVKSSCAFRYPLSNEEVNDPKIWHIMTVGMIRRGY